MSKKTGINPEGLESYIKSKSSTSFKSFHNGRTCFEAYSELTKNLVPVQQSVVSGAMADEIRNSFEGVKAEIEEIMCKAPEEERAAKVHELLAADPVLFLNDHGPDHNIKVIERANAIVLCEMIEPLTEFEAFLLLCAVQIHDIGNILGRAGHEKKLGPLFEEKCKNIIVDTPERRIIKNIAMAHGGRSKNGKDTISELRAREDICNEKVRTRLLAAILRFADELADDMTRANRVAIDLDILGTNSRIYHDYSLALHTVSINKDEVNHDYKVNLVFELEANSLKETFQVGGHNKYLLDEIYDRTLKMELERRYCMKFMYPYINIGRIDVNINVYGLDSSLVKNISYTLEDLAYPDNVVSVKSGIVSDTSVPSGATLLQELIEKGEINESD